MIACVCLSFSYYKSFFFRDIRKGILYENMSFLYIKIYEFTVADAIEFIIPTGMFYRKMTLKLTFILCVVIVSLIFYLKQS